MTTLIDKIIAICGEPDRTDKKNPVLVVSLLLSLFESHTRKGPNELASVEEIVKAFEPTMSVMPLTLIEIQRLFNTYMNWVVEHIPAKNPKKFFKKKDIYDLWVYHREGKFNVHFYYDYNKGTEDYPVCGNVEYTCCTKPPVYTNNKKNSHWAKKNRAKKNRAWSKNTWCQELLRHFLIEKHRVEEGGWGGRGYDEFSTVTRKHMGMFINCVKRHNDWSNYLPLTRKDDSSWSTIKYILMLQTCF